jgi:hypothetical protein
MVGAVLSGVFGQNGRNGEHNPPGSRAENTSISGTRDGRSLSISGWTDTVMRARSKPTRLELHRLKVVKNERKCELLNLSDLTAEEKTMVQRELVQDVRVAGIDFSQDGDELKFDRVYLDVLNEWGIMCPHPHSSVEQAHHGRAKRCTVCDCLLIGDLEGVKAAAK